MVLTTLEDSVCKKVGNVGKTSMGIQLVVNTKMELCGAFINTMNITFVNYTINHDTKKRTRKKKTR